MYNNLSRGILDATLSTLEEAVKQLGALPKLEEYIKGSGKPPKFIAGTFNQVQEQLLQLGEDLSINEIIVQDMMTDHHARLHSYELLAKMIRKD